MVGDAAGNTDSAKLEKKEQDADDGINKLDGDSTKLEQKVQDADDGIDDGSEDGEMVGDAVDDSDSSKLEQKE